MKNTFCRSAFPVLVVVALLVPASPAAAEYLIPPENSAATQYTEAIPTSGGRRDAERDDARGDRDPKEVLGNRNAQRLEGEGPSGRELAEFAATTAPATGSAAVSGGAGDSDDDGGATGGAKGSGRGGPGSGLGEAAPSGSSPLSEVIEQATGSSSSGQLGPLLPLLILAALAWAVWYALRQRGGAGGPRSTRL
jgi:hypothetical protein